MAEINEFRTEFKNAVDKSIPVYDDDAVKSLKGILTVLQKKFNGIEDQNEILNNELHTQNVTNEKNRVHDRVRSLASEKKNRAIQSVLNDKIDKNFNTLGSLLKDTLSNMSKDMSRYFTKSLDSFGNLAAIMRKANLSRAEKNQIQAAKSQGLTDVYAQFGMKLSGDEIADFLGSLAASNHSIEAMTREQRANYLALSKAGLDAEKAYSFAVSGSTEGIKDFVRTLNNPKVKQTAKLAIDNLVPEEINALGGVDKTLRAVAKSATDAQKAAGGALAPEALSTHVTAAVKASNGLIDRLKDEEVNSTIITNGDTKNLTNLKNVDPAAMRTGALGATGTDAAIFQNTKEENRAGESYSVEEIADALKDNTENGQIAWLADRAIAEANNKTNNLLGKITNSVDSIFGKVDFEKIITFNIALVQTALNSIIKLIRDVVATIKNKHNNAENKLSEVQTTLPNNEQNNKKPKMTPEQLDKEYQEALKSLKALPGNIKRTFGEKIDNFKKSAIDLKQSAREKLNALGSTVKKTVNSAGTHIKKATNSALSGLRTAGPHIKDTFSTLKKRGVIALSKIPDTFKGIGNKIKQNAGTIGKVGKGIGMGLGVATAGLGLLAATGAFDSLTPILEKFMNTLAPPLTNLVTTLAPTIQNLLDVLGPVLTEVINSLAPILDGVLKSLAPILKSIINAITPVLNSLVNSLGPILESIFKILTPIIDTLVQTLMPIFTTIIDTLSPILQTVLSVLSPILKTILDVLGPIFKIIAKITTPILKVIGSIFKTLAPIFKIALTPIAFALNLITAPLKLVAELLNKPENNTDIAGSAAEVKEQAKTSGDLETARNAAIVQTAYSQGFDKIERQDGESDKDYYARAVQVLKEYSNEWSFTEGNAYRRKNLKDIIANTTPENASQKITEALQDAIKNDNNTFGNTKKDDFYGKDIEDWRKLSPSALVTELKKIYGNDKDGIRRAVALLKDEKTAQEVELATGGVFNKATKATIGEAGKEAVLPLERPNDLQKVINDLTSSEQLNLLKILTNKHANVTFDFFKETLLKIFNNRKLPQSTQDSVTNSALDTLPKSEVPGDDPDTIQKILSYAGPYRQQVWELIDKGRTNKAGYGFKKRKEWYKEALANAANQEGRELIRGTYAERALEYGVTQLGKPYILRSLGKIGYVCNELVNACVKASGFDMKKFMVHSVKTTFANIQKGKYSDNNTYADFRLRPDLTPETATPGMVFFQDSRKNKEGGFQPGHIGLVYYGHQKLHSSGGSAKYDKDTFLPNWQTPCRGVTVTPFDSNDYMIGEFPDLFKQATGEWNPPKDSPTKFGPQPVSTAEVRKAENEGVKTDIPENATLTEQKRLAKEAIESVVKNADADVKTTAKQYAEQAALLLNGNNTKEVVESLSAIIHYLKTIASSPANKRNFTPASKPMPSVY